MEVYNQGVKVIIHYVTTRNIEAYHFKNGRGGGNTRDLCNVVIFHLKFMFKICCDSYKYARNTMPWGGFTFAF